MTKAAMMSAHFLLVDNSEEDPWLSVVGDAVSQLGTLRVCCAHDVTRIMKQQEYDVVIVDAVATNDIRTFVTHLRLLSRKTKIVVTTALPAWVQAREIFYAGAADYIPKALNKRELFDAFSAVLARSVGSQGLQTNRKERSI